MKKALSLAPATLTVALLLAITTPVSAQADFEVSNLTISPDSVKEGETVTITCLIENNGDETGTYTVELKINEAVEDTKTVEMEAGQSTTVTFTVTAGTAGEYIIDLDGWPGYFSVTRSLWDVFPTYLWIIIGAIIGVLVLFIIVLAIIPSGKKQPGGALKTKRAGRPGPAERVPTPTPTAAPFPSAVPGPTATPTATPTPFPMPGRVEAPRTPPTARAIFSVSSLTITPHEMKEGEPTTISAMVTNTGTESGKYSLVLRIGGVVESISELALAPGASLPGVFTVTKDAGTHHVEVDGLAGTLTVIALIPAHFSVSNLVIAPDRVKQGDSVVVSAVVTNTGEVAGTYSVVLKIKGVADTIEEVSLGPAGSQRVTFNVTKDTPGFYPVDLEGLTGRFVVEMVWNE